MTPQPGHQPHYHGTDEDIAAPARPPRTPRQRRALALMVAIAISVVLATVLDVVRAASDYARLTGRLRPSRPCMPAT